MISVRGSSSAPHSFAKAGFSFTGALSPVAVIVFLNPWSRLNPALYPWVRTVKSDERRFQGAGVKGHAAVDDA